MLGSYANMVMIPIHTRTSTDIKIAPDTTALGLEVYILAS